MAPYYGLPLVFTEGPVRYLLLPDGTAVRLPRFTGDAPARVLPPPGIALQEDGYLGPRALSPQQAAPREPDGDGEA